MFLPGVETILFSRYTFAELGNYQGSKHAHQSHIVIVCRRHFVPPGRHKGVNPHY